MKLHQQFDLNQEILRYEKSVRGIKIDKFQQLVEELTKSLVERGYIVIESSEKIMGIPRSITVVKSFSGSFVRKFSTKAREDFNSVSNKLGIDRLFE